MDTVNSQAHRGSGGHNLAGSIDVDVDVSVDNFETVQELSNVHMGNEGVAIGVGLSGKGSRGETHVS